MPQRIQVGSLLSASYELTRPADTTAYAAGDAIANSTTAWAVVPLQFTVSGEFGATGLIIGARLFTSSATAFAATRLWLFNRQPFAAAGYQADNSALALTYAAMTSTGGCMGYVDFATFTARTTSAVSIATSPQTELDFTCGPTNNVIYGLFEAMSAFTPASAQTFTATLSVRAS